jgi:hypothetical protein
VCFYKDVQPILQQHCQKCHADGGIAPFPLTSYEQAKVHAAASLSQVSARTMPPWGAQETPDCTPRFGWRHDPRLSPHEIDLLQAWQTQGLPEGDRRDAKPDPNYSLDPLPVIVVQEHLHPSVDPVKNQQ